MRIIFDLHSMARITRFSFARPTEGEATVASMVVAERPNALADDGAMLEFLIVITSSRVVTMAAE
jgi:hypothetical protein